MKLLGTVLSIFAVMIIITGCGHYSDISGKVVEETTGKPIEGALVVVEWDKTRGIPGMQYHDVHKIVETLTDKEGAFSLSGTFGFLIGPPRLLIYKEGYIPWRNDSIFPSTITVKNHEWIDKMTYKLKVFTDKNTFRQLLSFMDHGISGSGYVETPKYDALMNRISKQEKIEIENEMGKRSTTP